MVSAHDIAAYILRARGEMSPMKLQKLVYYSQAWSLVWDDAPLFSERIEAWANGPVVPALYQKHRGQFTLTAWEWGNPEALTPPQRDTVDRGTSVLRRQDAAGGLATLRTWNSRGVRRALVLPRGPGQRPDRSRHHVRVLQQHRAQVGHPPGVGRDKRRGPAAFEQPPGDKTPRTAVDPADIAKRRPSWRLANLDFEGPFHCNLDGGTVREIHAKLCGFETMQWEEIERGGSHNVDVGQLVKEARKRLEELRQGRS